MDSMTLCPDELVTGNSTANILANTKVKSNIVIKDNIFDIPRPPDGSPVYVKDFNPSCSLASSEHGSTSEITRDSDEYITSEDSSLANVSDVCLTKSYDPVKMKADKNRLSSYSSSCYSYQNHGEMKNTININKFGDSVHLPPPGFFTVRQMTKSMLPTPVIAPLPCPPSTGTAESEFTSYNSSISALENCDAINLPYDTLDIYDRYFDSYGSNVDDYDDYQTPNTTYYTKDSNLSSIPTVTEFSSFHTRNRDKSSSINHITKLFDSNSSTVTVDNGYLPFSPYPSPSLSTHSTSTTRSNDSNQSFELCCIQHCQRILSLAASHSLKAVELANTLRAIIGAQSMLRIREHSGGLLTLLEKYSDIFLVQRIPKNDVITLLRHPSGERVKNNTIQMSNSSSTTNCSNSGNEIPLPTTLSQVPVHQLPLHPCCCLHIAHLPPTITAEDLYDEFLPFGPIDSLNIIQQSNRRYAFLSYHHIEHAMTAKHELSSKVRWRDRISFAKKEHAYKPHSTPPPPPPSHSSLSTHTSSSTLSSSYDYPNSDNNHSEIVSRNFLVDRLHQASLKRRDTMNPSAHSWKPSSPPHSGLSSKNNNNKQHQLSLLTKNTHDPTNLQQSYHYSPKPQQSFHTNDYSYVDQDDNITTTTNRQYQDLMCRDALPPTTTPPPLLRSQYYHVDTSRVRLLSSSLLPFQTTPSHANHYDRYSNSRSNSSSNRNSPYDLPTMSRSLSDNSISNNNTTTSYGDSNDEYLIDRNDYTGNRRLTPCTTGAGIIHRDQGEAYNNHNNINTKNDFPNQDYDSLSTNWDDDNSSSSSTIINSSANIHKSKVDAISTSQQQQQQQQAKANKDHIPIFGEQQYEYPSHPPQTLRGMVNVSTVAVESSNNNRGNNDDVSNRLCDEAYTPTQRWDRHLQNDKPFCEAIFRILSEHYQHKEGAGTMVGLLTVSKLRSLLNYRLSSSIISGNIKSAPLRALLLAYPHFFSLEDQYVKLVRVPSFPHFK